jgi:hypothetical protein
MDDLLYGVIIGDKFHLTVFRKKSLSEKKSEKYFPPPQTAARKPRASN